MTTVERHAARQPVATPPVDPLPPDLEPETADAGTRAPQGQRLALGIGSTALLAAMATDALAVAGRHAGIILLGSIEIVQACIVVAASAALVATTMMGAHARVHILIEKVRPRPAAMLDRAADATGAMLFLWLALGSAWLAMDLWGGTEITEILHVPLRWLRVVWIVATLVIAGLFAGRAVARRR